MAQSGRSLSEIDCYHALGGLAARGAALPEIGAGIIAIVEQLTGVTGAVLAARPQSAQGWWVYPQDEALLAELGLRASAPPGGVVPVIIQGRHMTSHGLVLPPPQQAVLLLNDGCDLQLLKPVLGAVSLVLATALHATGATRNERLLGQMVRKLKAIQQVSYHINNSYDLQELSASICSIATQALGAQYAGLYHLVNGKLKMVEDLAVLKATGTGMSLIKMLQEARGRSNASIMGLDQMGFLAEVIDSGKPVAVVDLVDRPEDCPESIREHSLASVMATPLVTQREIVGIFLVGTQVPHAFSPSEQELMADLAQQATGAFITSKLYLQAVEEKQRVDRLVEQLKVLNQATAEIGKHLKYQGICGALIEHIPRLVPAQLVSVFVLRGESWEAVGDDLLRQPPASWISALSEANHPKSLILGPQHLAGTPYEGADWVVVFPLIQQQLQGMVVVAIAEGDDITALELLETLVGHTAMTLSNASLVERVETQAITDGLTGVFNRRYFNDRLNAELARALRYQHELSLIILDIDFFKKANDVLGHLGGDLVLKQLSAVLMEKVRKVDIVARYGGEEFAIILPETGLEAAGYVAEKIRSWIEEFPFTDQERLPHKVITSSLGVASYPSNANTFESLVSSADGALYEAKQAGRNRVCCAKSPVASA